MQYYTQGANFLTYTRISNRRVYFSPFRIPKPERLVLYIQKEPGLRHTVRDREQKNVMQRVSSFSHMITQQIGETSWHFFSSSQNGPVSFVKTYIWKKITARRMWNMTKLLCVILSPFGRMCPHGTIIIQAIITTRSADYHQTRATSNRLEKNLTYNANLAQMALYPSHPLTHTLISGVL